MRSYIFKKTHLKFLAFCFDIITWPLALARNKKSALPKKILVIRFDHMGDVVITEPFLDRLRAAYPRARIVFLASSLGFEAMKSLSYVDEFLKFDPEWFELHSRPHVSLMHWIQLTRLLRGISPDMIFELRGDIRTILSCRVSNPRAWLASYGWTGGGNLLDGEAPINRHELASQTNLKLLGDTVQNVPSNTALSTNTRAKAPIVTKGSNDTRKFRLILVSCFPP